MTENGNRTPPAIEGVDIPQPDALEVWNFIVDKGNEYLGETAFVQGGEFTDDDIGAIKNYYQQVLKYQEAKFGQKGAVFNRSLREHLGLSELIAKRAAPLLGVDTNLLVALALTHDFGRIFSHRRGRNNVIENALIKKLNITNEFASLLPPDSLWTALDAQSVQARLTSLTENNHGVTATIELIDVLAKWKDKEGGQLRRLTDIIPKAQAAQNPPDKDNMWPSEFTRQQKITSSTGNEAVSTKYSYLGQWFESAIDMSYDDFISPIEESLRTNPIPKDWLE